MNEASPFAQYTKWQRTLHWARTTQRRPVFSSILMFLGYKNTLILSTPIRMDSKFKNANIQGTLSELKKFSWITLCPKILAVVNSIDSEDYSWLALQFSLFALRIGLKFIKSELLPLILQLYRSVTCKLNTQTANMSDQQLEHLWNLSFTQLSKVFFVTSQTSSHLVSFQPQTFMSTTRILSDRPLHSVW